MVLRAGECSVLFPFPPLVVVVGSFGMSCFFFGGGCVALFSDRWCQVQAPRLLALAHEVHISIILMASSENPIEIG